MNNTNPNRLINEKSLYLRQHAYNPVDWYPWGEEAFKRAKDENKIIFLSIGYSSCHWCHVMERESFEDKEVAEVLNKYFIPIKVDREERPDIDNLYMNVCMVLNGTGGWPLNVFLTPDKKPFFATTYIPRYSKYGTIGIIELLTTINNLWKEKPQEIINSSESIIDYLKKIFYTKLPNNQPNLTDITNKVSNKLLDYYLDKSVYKLNKFPTFHNFIFLYDYLIKTKDKNSLNLIRKILREIRLGGVYDQIDGGFHRYSTDSEWILPHFEKMLYDQAFGMIAYSLFYQLTEDEIFRITVEEIFNYLTNNLTSEEGGFFCSEDAESDNEEGGFYTWTIDELRNILKQEYSEFSKFFYLKEEGNFQEEATSKQTGKNVITFKKEYIQNLNIEDYKHLRKLLNLLKLQRDKRIKPKKDTKILTDWNGMTILGLCISGLILNDKNMINHAIKCADFLISNVYVDKTLYHRYYDKEVGIDGFLDDYAFLIAGLFELYKTTLNEKYLKIAIQLCEETIEKFFDEKTKSFVITYSDELPLKPKEFLDSSYPSGNSVMINNLLTLYHITGSKEIEKILEDSINTAYSFSTHFLQSSTFLLHTLNLWNGEVIKLFIHNKPIKEINEITSKYPINLIPIVKSEFIDKISSISQDISQEGFYICKGTTCLPKVDTIDEVLKKLET